MVFDSSSRSPIKHALPLSHGLLVLVASWAAVRCSEPNTPPTAGTNTNWLVACDVDADCSNELSCHCGACSSGCSRDADCVAHSGSQCVVKAEQVSSALCAGTPSWSSQGICLPRCEPGGCALDQACVLGACVPLATIDTAFCAAAVEQTDAGRKLEEELIAAVEQARLSGGLACGSAAASGVLPLLRLDGRLSCAARVFARDIATNGAQGLNDSLGRGTTERLRLATYEARHWAEGYAWDATQAASALQVMLRDSDFCTGFVNPALIDLGVGHSGTTFVVTVAAE